MEIDLVNNVYVVFKNTPNVIIIKHDTNGVFDRYSITTDDPSDSGFILPNEAESFANGVVKHGYFVARYVESPFILVLVKE